MLRQFDADEHGVATPAAWQRRGVIMSQYLPVPHSKCATHASPTCGTPQVPGVPVPPSFVVILLRHSSVAA